MKNTTVINLFAGPAVGKSTLAASLYAYMKSKHLSCELVREYVKEWAWMNREIKPVDQIYLLGKQAQAESILYGKVKYIITDSPLLLPAVYQRLFYEGTYITDAAIGVMKDAKIEYKNYILERKSEYKTEGRFHSLEDSLKVDKEIPLLLKSVSLEYKTLTCEENFRLYHITNELGV